MTHSKWKRQLWLIISLVVVVLLAAAVFTLGSLNIPLRPEQGSTFAAFFALSTFITAALLVFALILTRSLVRLWSERSKGQMGSRFKVKMVLGAMGVSLLPVLFLFFFSYALVNRTLNMWFPRPLEIANEQSQRLGYDMGKASVNYLSAIAAKAAADGTPNQAFLGLSWSVDASWIVDSHGAVSSGVSYKNRSKEAAIRQLFRPSQSPRSSRRRFAAARRFGRRTTIFTRRGPLLSRTAENSTWHG